MEMSRLKAIRKNMDKFLTKFDDCIKTRPSREHLRTYVGGQLGDLARKSVEPIALEAGVAPRTLQEFLSLHAWDEESMRRRVQQLVALEHGDPCAIAVIDETSFPKKGTETTGVQRQYCGATGKKDNCVVTVHLGYAAEGFHALIDADIYLPQETWADNDERRRKAGIPQDVVFRPKWRKRRVEKAAGKIEYWQQAAAKAARCHRKRKLALLRKLGIRISLLTKCFR